jgi:hypothetical protein
MVDDEQGLTLQTQGLGAGQVVEDYADMRVVGPPAKMGSSTGASGTSAFDPAMSPSVGYASGLPTLWGAGPFPSGLGADVKYFAHVLCKHLAKGSGVRGQRTTLVP